MLTPAHSLMLSSMSPFLSPAPRKHQRQDGGPPKSAACFLMLEYTKHVDVVLLHYVYRSVFQILIFCVVFNSACMATGLPEQIFKGKIFYP